jgi:hypothetical protein
MTRWKTNRSIALAFFSAEQQQYYKLKSLKEVSILDRYPDPNKCASSISEIYFWLSGLLPQKLDSAKSGTSGN